MCSGARIKTGIVSVTKVAFFKSKAWVMKRCTLYDKGNNSAAILEVGEDSKSKDANKKSYSLENVQSIHMGIFKLKSFQVMILSKGFKLLFLVETEEEADSWVRHLKAVAMWEEAKKKKKRSASPDARSSVTDDSDFESCDNSDIYESYEASYFDVEIIKSDASVRCNLSGFYCLLLSRNGITILNRSRQVTYYEWPYRYIRRYGKTINSFTFEAGRKCQSGEGNFQFKTAHGQGPDVFENVALLVSLIKPNQSDALTPRISETKPLCYKEELERVISHQATQKMILNKTGKLQNVLSYSDENVQNSVTTPLYKNTTSRYSNLDNDDENEYSLLDLENVAISNNDKKIVDTDNDYESFVENIKTDSNENEYECLNISTSQEKPFKLYDHLNFHNLSEEPSEVTEKFKTWDYETLNSAKKTSEELESQYSELNVCNNRFSAPISDSTVAASEPMTAEKPEIEPVSISEYQVIQHKEM